MDDRCKFKVGQIVCVASLFGSPDMIVTYTKFNEFKRKFIITCLWYTNEFQVQEHDYPEEILKHR